MRRDLTELTNDELEKVLDRWFSHYIRLRYSDDNGYVHCATCGRLKFWREGHCGHYSKRNKAHRFNENNSHFQCAYCNTYLKGQDDLHARYIDKRYGDGTAELLRGTENKITKLTRFEYLHLINIYKNKAKQEAKKRGLEI